MGKEQRTPAQIIGADALTQLIFEGYVVVPASRDEQAEVVGWQIGGLPRAFNGCQCECHRRAGIIHMVACCSPTKGPLFSREWFEKRASEEGTSDPTTGVPDASPPAAAKGGVTIDPDLLAKQSTIEPDIAAVVYPNRSKLYSDFSGGVTEQAVEAACRAFYGEAAWQFPRGIISKPSSIIAMRRALTAALAVGDEGIREGRDHG